MSEYDSKNLESTLIYMRKVWGTEVFLNPEQVYSFLSDLAPELKNERKMVERLSRNGILSDFINNSQEDVSTQKRLLVKFTDTLINTEYVQADIAAEYLKIMVSVFGWKVEVSKEELLEQSSKPKELKTPILTSVSSPGDDSPMLRRAFLFLEDGDFSKADQYFEKVLDHEPENARAYLGKLMVEQCVQRQEDLMNCRQSFANSKNYQKAVRFGDSALSEFLINTLADIQKRNENERLLALYQEASTAMNRASDESSFRAAGNKFNVLNGYKDSETRAKECFQKAQVCHEQEKLREQKKKYEAAEKAMKVANDEKSFKKAAGMFREVKGYSDADALATECSQKARECLEEERRRWYYQAMALMNSANDEETYKTAERCFQYSQGYHNADELAEECKERALECREKSIIKAKEIAKEVERKQALFDTAYRHMLRANDEASYKQAGTEFMDLYNYKDSYEYALRCFESAEKCKRKEKRKRWGRGFEGLGRGVLGVILLSFIMLIIGIAISMGTGFLRIKNEQEKIEQIREQINHIEVGELLSFGSEKGTNETIQWQVMEKKEGRILVVSDKAIYCGPYQTFSGTSSDWERSQIRIELNNRFLTNYFNDFEKPLICSEDVFTKKRDSDEYYSTKDKIFILSEEEINKYYPTNDDRVCHVTESLQQSGASDPTYWWVRSPASPTSEKGLASVVTSNGTILEKEHDVNDENIAIRPAMWLKTDS